jgi:hypothetical protein
MGNKYLEKVASILKLPGPKANALGEVVRSAKAFSGKKNFGFHSMAKTPMIERIKASLH